MSDIRSEKICAQCGGGPSTDPPTDAPTVLVGDVWVHPECLRFWISEHKSQDAARQIDPAVAVSDRAEWKQIKEFVAACRRQWPGAMIVLRPDTTTAAAPRCDVDQHPKPRTSQSRRLSNG
jgi:hypothetical protein